MRQTLKILGMFMFMIGLIFSFVVSFKLFIEQDYVGLGFALFIGGLWCGLSVLVMVANNLVKKQDKEVRKNVR